MIIPVIRPIVVIFLFFVFLTLGYNSNIIMYRSIPIVRASNEPITISLTVLMFRRNSNRPQIKLEINKEIIQNTYFLILESLFKAVVIIIPKGIL